LSTSEVVRTANLELGDDDRAIAERRAAGVEVAS
jgi:hypothetical protein